MQSKNEHTSPVSFTDHQIEIIWEWSQQPTIAAVAREMGLSEHTVQTHLGRMRRKLKVSRTFDVYLYLKEQGFF